MGRNSSGGGGARASASGGSTQANAASDVSASVAGYADLVTPNGVKITPAGTITLRQPKTADQATRMLSVVEKAHEIAQREQKAVSGLDRNNPKSVAANLRAAHTQAALQRAIKMSRKVL